AESLGFANVDEMYSEVSSLRNAAAEQARFRQEMEAMRQTNQDLQLHIEASKFYSQVEDFPDTPEAQAAIATIIDKNGWPADAAHMADANAIAIRQGIYQPIPADLVPVTTGQALPNSRPQTAPMLSYSNPDTRGPSNDPWSMPLDQLRRQVLAGGGN